MASPAVAIVAAALSCVYGPPAWAGGTASTASGILVGAWADPHPRSKAHSKALFALALPDGRELPLDVSRNESAAARLLGQEVVVTGQRTPGPLQGPLRVDSLQALRPDRGTRASGVTTNAVTGTRKVLYLLVKFSDDVQVPHDPAFYTDLGTADAPPAGSPLVATVNGFFEKASYGQFRWTAHVGGMGGVPATGWLTLPKPKSGYADCSWSAVCADIGTLFTDAMALAVARGIDVSVYDNVNVVLSNDLDCCAWGGGKVYNGKYYGATWGPPWAQDVSTYGHEMGHSLGLPHSGWTYFAYDSPWDIMSGQSTARASSCGSYFSRNSGSISGLACLEPGAGYLASYADALGWLPAANVVQVTAGASLTVQLQALTEPLAAGVKMIRVCLPGEACSGSSAHYLTVEARVRGLGDRSAFDNGLPGEGILIHDFRANRGAIGSGDSCYSNSASVWAVPIDATAGDYEGSPTCSSGGRTYPNYALYNAQWRTGQVFVDPATSVRIAIAERDGASWSVTLGTPGTAPARPVEVAAAPGDSRVVLTWPPVPGATTYDVLMGTVHGEVPPTPVRSGITGNAATITGLANGRKYFFQVVAVNASGRSPRSREVAAIPARYVSVSAIDLSSLAATAGAQRSWIVPVPRNARDLRFQISGGTGDADLYVKYDADPVLDDAVNDERNCVPYETGNEEACPFAAPLAGKWHVLVHAFESYANLRLVVRFDAPERSQPRPFDFEDVTVTGAQSVRSNVVTVGGINVPVPIQLTGAASARFRINGGPATRGPTTVVAGDQVRVALDSSADPGTRKARITIGGVADDWVVTTEAP